MWKSLAFLVVLTLMAFSGQYLELYQGALVLEPITGVGLLWVLVSKTRAELALAAAAIIAVSTFVGLQQGRGTFASVVSGIGCVIVTHLGRDSLRWLARNTKTFQAFDLARMRSLGDVLRVVLGTIPPILLAQVLMTLVLVGEIGGSPGRFALAQYVSILVLTVPALAIRSGIPRMPRMLALEGVAIAVTAIGLIVLVFTSGLPIAFLCILPVIWAGLRLPLQWAALLCSFLAILTGVLSAEVSTAPFASIGVPLIEILAIQGFMCTCSVLGVTLSASSSERRNWLAAIRRSEYQAFVKVNELEEQLAELRAEREPV